MFRHHGPGRVRVKLAFGENPTERPLAPKAELLVIITVSFVAGAIAGAGLGVRLRHIAMVIPSVAVAALGVYALLQDRDPE